MQEERALSIAQQLREIRQHAEQNGIDIVGEFRETGSAFKKGAKRIEFHRMIAEAKATSEVEVILVHDLSRFSRDSVKGRALVRELGEHGVRVISVTDPEFDPETVTGVYMEAITYAKNEAYSREIAFHTRKGQRSNARTRDPETGWCYKNGGQALWGYRTERLVRGETRRRPIVKSIWVPDDSVIAGRPVHEWARHCLVELAAKGASLDDLRDFCNEKEIPARRQRYWSTSTWNSLLQPNALLKYAGYGVWNVHRKNGTKRPPTEWEIVPNAHEALITEEEARAIADARRRSSRARFDKGYSRSKGSRYLLSGGLFTCGRCGANMVGRRNGRHDYYVCGSQPYRKGMGCGPGVYVPKSEVEAEVIDGLRELVGVCSDPQGFTKHVNEELRTIWESSNGHAPEAEEKLSAVEAKISNIRQAIEDGLADTSWANGRLVELHREKTALQARARGPGTPPQIDAEAAMSYRRDLARVFRHGKLPQRKSLVRAWVQELQLAPEDLTVQITYQVPEPVVNSVVARALYVAMHNQLAALLRRRWRLPIKRRRVRAGR